MERSLINQMLAKVTDTHSRSIHSLLGVYLANGEVASEYIRDRASDGDRVFLELLVYPDMGIYSISVIIEDSSETHPDKHCVALEYSFHGTDDQQGMQNAMLIRMMVTNVLCAHRVIAENPSAKETDEAIRQMQAEGIKSLTAYTLDRPTEYLTYS